MTRPPARRLLMTALCGLFALLFAGLGVWQVERLQWKLALIRTVDARLAAAPVATPPRSAWASLDPKALEYRKLKLTGRFDLSRTTRVDALTDLGPGWWVLTPFVTADGTILVNRGFVPKTPVRQTDPQGPVIITGLLRASEPGGRFLRANDPGANLFYSRDVAAIASARGLRDVAPFFVDAAAGRDPAEWPRGGLTVVRFRNTHLIYALTWFGLSALSIFGLVLIWRRPARSA